MPVLAEVAGGGGGEEPVAYMVTQAHGLHSRQYSINCVVGWAATAATAGRVSVELVVTRILQHTRPADPEVKLVGAFRQRSPGAPTPVARALRPRPIGWEAVEPAAKGGLRDRLRPLAVMGPIATSGWALDYDDSRSRRARVVRGLRSFGLGSRCPVVRRSDLLVSLLELAMDDGRIDRVGGSWFTSAAIVLCTLDSLVAELKCFVQPSLTLELLDRLNKLEVVNSLDHARSELFSSRTTPCESFSDHPSVLRQRSCRTSGFWSDHTVGVWLS